MSKLWIAALGAMVCAAAAATDAKAPSVSDPVYTGPVHMVDIGHGQRLNLYCLGQGSPVVVFDAGMGDSTLSWAMVQPAVAKKTMTCSFDRAGLGFSDAARRPSTPRNQAEDLHALLQAAHIAPPYILVGHSMAGMNVRVYADEYPAQVAGMVLVEGSHEDQSSRGWAISKPGQQTRWDTWLKDMHTCVEQAKKGLVKGTPMYDKCVTDTKDPQFSDAINQASARYEVKASWQEAVASERENVFYASAEETRQTRKNFGDIPLIVMTHAPFEKNEDETQDQRDQETLLWEGLHNQVAAMSSRGINIIVPGAKHYVQYDKPQVVIDAVEQAVSIAREHQGYVVASHP